MKILEIEERVNYLKSIEIIFTIIILALKLPPDDANK